MFLTLPDILGLISLILALLGLYFYVQENRKDRSSALLLSGDHREAITGVWQGTVVQRNQVNNQPVTNEVTLRLHAGSHQIAGRLHMRSYNGPEYVGEFRLRVEGLRSHNHFFDFHYENIDGSAIQFGHFLLELSSDHQQLAGEFLGYGEFSDQFIGGRMVLERR